MLRSHSARPSESKAARSISQVADQQAAYPIAVALPRRTRSPACGPAVRAHHLPRRHPYPKDGPTCRRITAHGARRRRVPQMVRRSPNCRRGVASSSSRNVERRIIGASRLLLVIDTRRSAGRRAHRSAHNAVRWRARHGALSWAVRSATAWRRLPYGAACVLANEAASATFRAAPPRAMSLTIAGARYRRAADASSTRTRGDTRAGWPALLIGAAVAPAGCGGTRAFDGK
jgi:hypothetical protein